MARNDIVGKDSRVFIMTEDVALQMLREDIRSLKTDQRDDFSRLSDKIDDLRADMNKRTGEHDRDITKLTTQAEIAGQRAGRISGAAVSIAIYIGITVLRFGLERFAA